LYTHEKEGSLPKNLLHIKAFYNVFNDCDLNDLGFRGPRLTWMN
jgi:hypothetical protein